MVQPRSQGTLSFPGKLVLNLATKGPKIEIFPEKILISLRLPELLLVRQNMKNALNIWPQLFKGWITLSTG